MSRSNEHLVRIVRAGQIAGEQLCIVEMGFRAADDLVIVCKELLDVGFGEEVGLTKGEVSITEDELAELGELIRMTTEEMKVALHGDHNRDRRWSVLENGLRTVERNLMLCLPFVSSDIYDGERQDIKAFIETVRDRFEERMFQGVNAKDRLCEENMGLIKMVASNVSKRTSVDFSALFSVAAEEFIHCIDHSFDPDRGVKFSTYATNCMTNKCVSQSETPEDLPFVVKSSSTKQYVNRVLSGDLSLDASDVSESRRAGEVEIRQNILNAHRTLSMDQRISDDDSDGILLQDTVADPGVDMDVTIGTLATRQVLHLLFQGTRMQPCDRILVAKRIAIEEGISPATYEEVAALLHRLGYDDCRKSRQRMEQRMQQVRPQIVEGLQRVAPDFLELLIGTDPR